MQCSIIVLLGESTESGIGHEEIIKMHHCYMNSYFMEYKEGLFFLKLGHDL